MQYDNATKMYIINKKYKSRPRFEDDEEIVEIFTEYDEKKTKRDALRRELDRM